MTLLNLFEDNDLFDEQSKSKNATNYFKTSKTILQIRQLCKHSEFSRYGSTQLVVVQRPVVEKQLLIRKHKTTYFNMQHMSYKVFNCFNIANSVGMVPIKSFRCSTLSTKKKKQSVSQNTTQVCLNGVTHLTNLSIVST